jgi:hypothetical protein
MMVETKTGMHELFLQMLELIKDKKRHRRKTSIVPAETLGRTSGMMDIDIFLINEQEDCSFFSENRHFLLQKKCHTSSWFRLTVN